MAIGRKVTPASSIPARRRINVVRAGALACLVAGAMLLATFALGMWNGYSDQQQLNQQWQQEVGTAPLTPPAVIDRSLQHPVKGVDFAIRVPKLKYFAAVREGTNTTVLYSGPGHYPGTVWPGDQGTVGVAAHNVYWINFPQLKSRDEIDIETRYGTYRYRVTGSKIVNPNDRTVVVSNAPGFNLVLTTCWPLWAGAFATQRYVIFAEQYSPGTTAPASAS
jgi:LPXTG-site transpeptidase (sortase) family protein